MTSSDKNLLSGEKEDTADREKQEPEIDISRYIIENFSDKWQIFQEARRTLQTMTLEKNIEGGASIKGESYGNEYSDVVGLI